MNCCVSAHGPELSLLLRLMKGGAAMIWRAITLPYAETVASAVFILTFLWVLVFQKGTPISTGESAETPPVRRAA